MAALTRYLGTVNTAPTNQPGIAAAAGGDSIPGDERTLLLVNNPTGGALTLTVEASAADNFGLTHATAHDAGPHSIPASGWRLLGPFPASRFNDATQRVQLTYSAAGLLLWPIGF